VIYDGENFTDKSFSGGGEKRVMNGDKGGRGNDKNAGKRVRGELGREKGLKRKKSQMCI
jgi:hypothetical protein